VKLLNIKKNITPSPLSLKKYYHKRNKILILRRNGGLGDILMHRMLFEDFKKIDPEFKITFACPAKYHYAVEDHPYIDCIKEADKVNLEDYIAYYNTSTACVKYEIKKAPLSGKHRSDIWSEDICGVNLTSHEMHFNLEKNIIEKGKDELTRVGHLKKEPRPSVILCPVSSTPSKDFTDQQLEWIVKKLRHEGCHVYYAHNIPINKLEELNVSAICGYKIKEWMAIINAADYIISVDTAGFHLAGGMKKPLMGVFSHTDGKVYGKYYNFILVQKHRDDGNWDCGPCYNWINCPISKETIKPCITELTQEMINEGIKKMFIRWPKKKLSKL
jgi:ADP-heptose:LPS heptosyltransferase